MFALIDNLARRLIRQGLRRGLLEGNPTWVVIGALALVIRLLTRPEKEQVIRERLKLGESITVTHRPAAGSPTHDEGDDGFSPRNS